ncbi:phage tail protein [Escherichia coli]|uniref:gp53-like domain-containing protein n=1 Tax=Escherichia coli TaxID=562 RepID=UPI0020250DA4|nr:phage tail protein [Escherichia coli]
MAINNFKPFALDPNANVTSQADWEALPALLSGFTAGKASSAQVNKAIRQASFIAAALAQYTANKSGLDVLDDGDLNGFISKMGTAFGKDFQALDATLSALAGLATGANKLPYFTGNDTAAQTDLTSVGRDIIGKNTIADILTYLGLGEAAKRNVGTGANQIPDMSAYSSGSGWQKLPDGSIEQWGRINFPTNAAAVSTNVTFPIPFTQEPDVVIVYDGGFGGGNMWGATNWTRTGFVAHCNYGFEGGAFFAKGR